MNSDNVQKESFPKSHWRGTLWKNQQITQEKRAWCAFTSRYFSSVERKRHRLNMKLFNLFLKKHIVETKLTEKLSEEGQPVAIEKWVSENWQNRIFKGTFLFSSAYQDSNMRNSNRSLLKKESSKSQKTSTQTKTKIEVFKPAIFEYDE